MTATLQAHVKLNLSGIGLMQLILSWLNLESCQSYLIKIKSYISKNTIGFRKI